MPVSTTSAFSLAEDDADVRNERDTAVRNNPDTRGELLRRTVDDRRGRELGPGCGLAHADESLPSDL